MIAVEGERGPREWWNTGNEVARHNIQKSGKSQDAYLSAIESQAKPLLQSDSCTSPRLQDPNNEAAFSFSVTIRVLGTGCLKRADAECSKRDYDRVCSDTRIRASRGIRS